MLNESVALSLMFYAIRSRKPGHQHEAIIEYNDLTLCAALDSYPKPLITIGVKSGEPSREHVVVSRKPSSPPSGD